MIDRTELERRLRAWADDYGGGRYEDIGFGNRHPLKTLIEHGGFMPESGGFQRPPIRTASDDVEQAVKDMESGGMFKHGRVLRCEYFLAEHPEEEKLRRLRKVGLPMSRAGYYNFLAQAKAYVLGAIGRVAA